MPVVKHAYTDPVADDASSSWVMPSHWNASHSILGYTFKDVLYLTTTTSATMSISASVAGIFIRMWGGGGGGAGASCSISNAACGGGGGAGGYQEFFIGISSITAAGYQYKCGAGGAGGASGSNAGASGATSWFGEASPGTFTALPGLGGAAPLTAGITLASALGGAGGSASNGTFQITGESGQKGVRFFASVAYGGRGADAVYATGIGGDEGPNSGTTSTGYGSGGGGAALASTTGNGKGGDGRQGLIIVEQYY